MATLYRSLSLCGIMLCIGLLLVAPGSAVTAAVYGDTGGLNLSLHQDVFAVSCTLAGAAGSELDAGQSCFTNASTDVIFLYGDAGFSQKTVTSISDAVVSGKVLVVGEKDLARFSDIIPVQSAGTANGSATLSVTSPNATLSQDIFAGLPFEYSSTIPVSGRTKYTAKDGATTLMSFDNGDPAVAFTRDGNGYVVAWLPPTGDAYLSASQADLISERLITHLLALRTNVNAAQTTTASTVATTAAAQTATVTVTTPAATETLGEVSVYSSPLNANVYIDGVYKGIAPVNLTGISAGNHALKLALADYYDYDTTITVMGGGTITAFGSLAPRESTTVAATTAPVAVTTTDASSIFSSPAVVAAVLGIITAIIGAVVTLFTIYHKHKQP